MSTSDSGSYAADSPSGMLGKLRLFGSRVVRWLRPASQTRLLTYQPVSTAAPNDLTVPVARPVPAPRASVPTSPEPPAAAADLLVKSRAATAQRRAAIMTAFDAAHPVERRGDLLGRNDKLDLLFDAVLEQGHHAIVHGARGSGKTSLVRVFGDYADQQQAVVVYLACEPTGDFDALVIPYLNYIPPAALQPGGRARLEAGLSGPERRSGARALASLLADTVAQQVILILDEFDRVVDQDLQSQMATFMKLLADARVPVQLVLVGIAQSVDTLIASHLSLRRHVTAVDVGRLSDAEAKEIIDRGCALSHVAFDSAASDLIVRVSLGSPYHIRLFCQSAAMAMLRKGSVTVDRAVAVQGLSLATTAWGRLNETDHAIFTAASGLTPARRRKLETFAAALVADHGVSPADQASAKTEIDLLGPALAGQSARPGWLAFRDSLAPQFLLALLASGDPVANGSDASPPLAPVAAAPHTLSTLA